MRKYLGNTAQRLYVICLHIFRHFTQKSLDRRKPACMIFMQSDEKSDCASDAQSLCSIAFILLIAAGILSGCSDREKSSASSEKEKVPVSDIKGETTIPETSESAALKDSEYKFKVEDDGIMYYDGSSVLQKIELDCTDLIKRAESYDRDPEEFLIISDFNFDGYDDLFVPDIIGTPNIPGTYFYMNPTRNFNSFEKWDVLNEIGQLMDVDADNQVLDLAVNISAADHETTVYRWESGTLVPVSRKHDYVSNEDGQHYIYRFEYDENGEEILVIKECVTVDEDGNEMVSEVSGR